MRVGAAFRRVLLVIVRLVLRFAVRGGAFVGQAIVDIGASVSSAPKLEYEKLVPVTRVERWGQFRKKRGSIKDMSCVAAYFGQCQPAVADPHQLGAVHECRAAQRSHEVCQYCDHGLCAAHLRPHQFRLAQQSLRLVFAGWSQACGRLVGRPLGFSDPASPSLVRKAAPAGAFAAAGRVVPSNSNAKVLRQGGVANFYLANLDDFEV